MTRYRVRVFEAFGDLGRPLAMTPLLHRFSVRATDTQLHRLLETFGPSLYAQVSVVAESLDTVRGTP